VLTLVFPNSITPHTVMMEVAKQFTSIVMQSTVEPLGLLQIFAWNVIQVKVTSDTNTVAACLQANGVLLLSATMPTHISHLMAMGEFTTWIDKLFSAILVMHCPISNFKGAVTNTDTSTVVAQLFTNTAFVLSTFD